MSPFVEYTLPALTPLALVDIVIVAFLVYQALNIVRGTRAFSILVGMGVVLFLYALSVWTGLNALHSVLSFFVPYSGLLLVILFQSEIRRTLARIGRKGWTGASRRPESIDEILLALPKLAERKVGALIVIERDIGLRTFIESGVRMEAHCSRDLLLAIFEPGAALHDGAVIVQKDHIAAAACFLPLTTHPQNSELGTRHRAAIGVTEETDAVSVIVSEETGMISIAALSEIQRGLTVKQVDEFLSGYFGKRRAHWHPPSPPSPALPRNPETAARR